VFLLLYKAESLRQIKLLMLIFVQNWSCLIIFLIQFSCL